MSLNKEFDIENYILNPNTGKYVKRTSEIGKKLCEGIAVEHMLSKNNFGIALITAIKEHLNLSDQAIKNAIESSDLTLPRTFPKKWGGTGKLKMEDNEKPKRPLNGYNIFSSEFRQKHKEIKGIKLIMAQLSKSWKELTQEQRDSYNKTAEVDRQRYRDEMKIYREKHPDPPKKPSKTTGFRIYYNEVHELVKSENAGVSNGREITKLIGEMWNDLSQEEKNEYNVKADEANSDFEERLTEYTRTPPSSPYKKTPVTSPDTTPKPSPSTEKEKEKAADADKYIYNESSKRYVKRSSKIGKILSKIQEDQKYTEPDQICQTTSAIMSRFDDLFEEEF